MSINDPDFSQPFPSPHDPQGITGYNHELDHARLSTQMERIWELTRSGAWHTLSEIEHLTGDPQASISAHLRSFRKLAHGGHTLDKRRVHGEDSTSGWWEYRVTPNPANPELIPATTARPTDTMTCPTCSGTGRIDA